MSKTKKYLMLLAAIGLIATAAGGVGTFAGFNAEVANTGNIFATGTLLLHNTANGTTCTSEADSGNSNVLSTNGCATLFSYSPATANSVTDSSGTYEAHLTLTNAGTVEAQDIKLRVPGGCASGSYLGSSTLSSALVSGNSFTTLSINALTGSFTTGDPVIVTSGSHTQTFRVSAPASAGATSISVTAQNANFSYPIGSTVGGPTFSPPGNLCTGSQVAIIETDSSFNHDSTNHALGCAFGTVDPSNSTTGAGCLLTNAVTLSNLPSSDTPLTLANAANGNSSTNLSADKSRYFAILIKPPTPLGNVYQNRKATFDLVWHIDQV